MKNLLLFVAPPPGQRARGTFLSALINAVPRRDGHRLGPVTECLTAWNPNTCHKHAQDIQAGPKIQWKLNKDLNNDLRVMSQPTLLSTNVTRHGLAARTKSIFRRKSAKRSAGMVFGGRTLCCHKILEGGHWHTPIIVTSTLKRL